MLVGGQRVTTARVVVGTLRPGHYFGERSGVLPGSGEPVAEKFSVVAGPAGATLLVLDSDSSACLDAFLAARFLDENPHGFNTMSHQEVVDAYMSFTEKEEHFKLRQQVKADARYRRQYPGRKE